MREEAKKLLQLIGGKENVAALTHCMTRLRFVLVDETKANVEEIKKLDFVKGVFNQAGQFQVIIGNQVNLYYKEFISVAGIDGASKEEVKQVAKNNQNILQRIMTNLAEIFAPILPALVVGGLILGFRNVIGDIKLFDANGNFTFSVNNATQTLVNISPFFSGVNSFLWLLGEAIFHFLPVGIVWSVTKKMGGTEILGIVLGITLVSPQLLNAYAVSGAQVIPTWDFGYFKINMIGYQAQVIPAILSGLSLVYLERFFRKVVPNFISMILVPFLTILLSVIIAHTLLGPIGWFLGTQISKIVYLGLTSSFRVIFAGIFGFVYAPLVITGLHHMTNAIDLQLSADFGGTLLWPMIALSNIAQGSAVLGMVILQKRNKKEQEVNIPSMVSCYLGVTEPAMFGVNLKYVFPFICALISSSIAAMVSVGFGVMANSIGVGGLPGILSIKVEYWGIFLVCMLIVIILPALLTYIYGKRKGIK